MSQGKDHPSPSMKSRYPKDCRECVSPVRIVFAFLHDTGASYSTEKNRGLSKPVCGAHCAVSQPVFRSL
ncbi:coiled-coil domain containing 53, isoform CRA_b [Mus musculus]|nr:coiled-coil domain containing 53, isoform CRA_b [Mus musculus]